MTLEGTLETAADGTRDAVMFVFTVSNSGGEPVDLQFSDACKAEFVLKDDGDEVWRFSEGRMFAQVLSSETLEAGAETTYEAEWSDPEPGDYTAAAELRAQDERCTARAGVSVPS